MPTGSPNRRGVATDERILAAARQVLVEKGLDLTIEDVARAAGTTRMTVHRHVGTRQELLMSLVVDATERVADGLREILDAAAPLSDRLVEAIVYVVDSARPPPVRRAIALASEDPRSGWSTIDTEGFVMAEVLEFIRPRLAEAAVDEPLRAGIDETASWLLRQVQLYLLVPPPFGDDLDALRQEIRTFVVPAVLADPPPTRPAPRAPQARTTGTTSRTRQARERPATAR